MKRMPPPDDRIIIAWLSGASSRHAAWAWPQGEAKEAAIAELREIATVKGKLRTDLLAEWAGIMLGTADVMGPPFGLQNAIRGELLLDAGAGPPELIEQWRVIGQRREAGPLPGRDRPQPHWKRPMEE